MKKMDKETLIRVLDDLSPQQIMLVYRFIQGMRK